MDIDDPVELVPGVWQIRQQLSAEVPLYLHIVRGPLGCALVDGGLPSSLPAIERLMSAADVRDADLRFLLNTHGHHDHIGTFAALRQRSGARVVADPEAVRWIEDLTANLREFALHRPDIVADTPELRAELAPTFSEACPVDVVMTDGGSVRLGGDVVLQAFQLPGHVTGELGWLERSTRTLILGDIVTGTSWSFFHGHVLPTQLRHSLHRLRTLTLDEGVQLVCFAHYSSRTSEEFLDLLSDVERYLEQVTETIEGALGDVPRSFTEVWQRTCAEFGRAQEFRGLAMVQAHLREAVTAGRARCVGPDLYTAVRSGG
jgi:glyoxylase-like metal-dependent hydrolase (beta-lactamase superfamily II)